MAVGEIYDVLSVGFNRAVTQNSVPPAVADVIARWRYRVAI
jgi:hypothetical protein